MPWALAALLAAGAASVAAQAGEDAAATAARILAGGDAAAQIALAQRYENAEGVPRDYSRALALYCAASAEGDARASYAIGWMFINGRGVKRDDAVGAGWLHLAALRGHSQAARVLRHLGAVTQAAPAGCPTPQAEAAPPRRIAEIVARISRKYRVDPKLVLAVIATESSFDAKAVSPRHARGLMQLTPETAARFGVRNSFDPAQNVDGGVRYLRWLIACFKGDVAKVIAAYNAGEGAVQRYRGVPPFPETRAYLAKVRRLYPARHHPYERLALAEH